MKNFMFWLKLAKLLPKILVYASAINMLAEISTNEKYSNKAIPDFGAMDTIGFYRTLHGLDL